MRLGKKYKLDRYVYKSKFAWLPITINGETRWLEKVKIEGRYRQGGLFIYWENYAFIDKTNEKQN